eukprot:CAMPEP_0172166878 /NCGR_PEP_ID=MMETSP1050-20130122/9251_1 /TAXON_ID=233186 /ORGANISM="Cryptomonas curvata, Strain CCAP979/52" /LENGTH=101 /DNA_ID=CAMNT_0012837587 /DNA_START=110 /DNA_END=412 /DNA_ORIENTATION=+
MCPSVIYEKLNNPGEETAHSWTCPFQNKRVAVKLPSMETVRMRPDTNFVIGISLKSSSMVPKPVSVALSRSQNAPRMNAGRLDHVIVGCIPERSGDHFLKR